MKPKLTKIRVENHNGAPQMVVFDFDNDQHHAAYIKNGATNREIARELMRMARALEHDSCLNKDMGHVPNELLHVCVGARDAVHKQ